MRSPVAPTRRCPSPSAHTVLGHPLQGPWPDGVATAVFGLGCFWGAEKLFWELPGVYCTAAGYAGGYTPNPTYEEVCSGRTGHTEVVLVVFDPAVVTLRAAAQGVLGGPRSDARACARATTSAAQYRSAIYFTDDEQRAAAEATARRTPRHWATPATGTITTEIAPLGDFFYAEPYHQQYLDKNPDGYCPLARHRRLLRSMASPLRSSAPRPGPGKAGLNQMPTATRTLGNADGRSSAAIGPSRSGGSRRRRRRGARPGRAARQGWR